MRDECDSESSSIESGVDEDRLYLQVGEKLKQILDYDREMIVRRNKQHILPAELPAVTILENFVKHSALKLVFCNQTVNDAPRRRNSQQKREINFDKLNQTVSLLKEVADGLRIYLDFILKEHLLYKEEKEQGEHVLSEENLKNFTYIASEKICPDFLNLKFDRPETTPAGSEFSEPHSMYSDASHPEDSARRRLRSYRSAETEPELTIDPNNFFETNLLKNDSHSILSTKAEGLRQEGASKTDPLTKTDLLSSKHDACISSIASTSSGGSTPHSNILSGYVDITKSIPPLNSSVSLKTREFLQNVFSWQILPSNAPAEASMIFGAVHLARLIIKLPDFLNATHMSDEKLAALAPLLDSFFKYLESHKEWFGEHNYKDRTPSTTTADSSAPCPMPSIPENDDKEMNNQ